MSTETIKNERITVAIRYLLQLAIEHQTDKASYADGAAVIEDVVGALESHLAKRITQKRIALVAELVAPIHERLKLEASGTISRSQMLSTISHWLHGTGIARSADDVAMLLEQPIRIGARSRTELEKLLDRLASLVDISQSQFEKVVGVVERGKATKGRLGTPLIHERAALDSAPTRAELLLYTLHVLDIDEETGQRIVSLLPEEEIEAMTASVEQRAYAAEVFAATKEAAGKNRAPYGPEETPDSG